MLKLSQASAETLYPSKRVPIFPGTPEANVKTVCTVPIGRAPISRSRTVLYYRDRASEGDYGGGVRVGRPFGAHWLAPLRGGAGPRCP